MLIGLGRRSTRIRTGTPIRSRLFKQSAFDPTSACNNKASFGPLTDYINYGYVPSPEHSSTTLEAITDDRSAAALLQALPAPTLQAAGVTQDDISKLFTRAGNWQNIFDNSLKTRRARTAGTPEGKGGYTMGALIDGSFHESTETNYFWSFAQDWTALVNKLGPDRAAAKTAAMERLNKLFDLNADLTNSEPDSKALNHGERYDTYYMGNEMNFSSPWAYNWIGRRSTRSTSSRR